MENIRRWFVGCVTIMCINNVRSQCTCTENKKTMNCVQINLDTEHSQSSEEIFNIDLEAKHVLPENAISSNRTTRIKLLCNIKTLKSNSFMNQKQLTSLDLSENFISTIPNDFFAVMPQLRNLNLSHNTLQNPTLDTFYALNNLIVLDISYNEISNLVLGVLDEMKGLKELYLNNNKIPLIELGVFDELHNLVLLDLSYNHLNEIVLGLFDQSQKLVDVNLTGNYFIEIPLGTFDSIKNVVQLSLRNCQIENLPLGVFDQTTKLKELDISKNKIKELALGIFDQLKELSTINLSECTLSEIPDHLFDQNGKLEKVDLSSNKLQTIPEGLFRSNESFKYLNLSTNSISDLPLRIFQYTSLTEIDISYNKITTIKPDLLNMETLERIYAQNNHIDYLDELTFAAVNYRLKYLDIRNNRLAFLGENFFDWVVNLERIEFFGNPWDCECLNELFDFLTKRFIDYASKDYLEGKLPLCVSMEMKTCDITKINRVDYYNLYKAQLRLERK